MPVSETMVERGARGIATFLSDGDGGPLYDNLSEKNKEAALDTARACLTAALSDQVVVPKEPTQAMRLAGVAEYARTDVPLSEAPTIVFDRIYKAMIAAASPPSSTAGESQSG